VGSIRRLKQGAPSATMGVGILLYGRRSSPQEPLLLWALVRIYHWYKAVGLAGKRTYIYIYSPCFLCIGFVMACSGEGCSWFQYCPSEATWSLDPKKKKMKAQIDSGVAVLVVYNTAAALICRLDNPPVYQVSPGKMRCHFQNTLFGSYFFFSPCSRLTLGPNASCGGIRSFS